MLSKNLVYNTDMKILDFLRKTGILRFGTKKGTYTNALNMPPEFLFNGVFNAKKDLTTKEDIQKYPFIKYFIYTVVTLTVLVTIIGILSIVLNGSN